MVNYTGRLRLPTAILASVFILLTATLARPLDGAIDGVLQQWNSTSSQSLTRRWDRCDWAHIATVANQRIAWDDDECTQAAKKGHALLCTMANPSTQQSVYTQYSQLAAYGYTPNVKNPSEYARSSNTEEALRQIGISATPSRWVSMSAFHHQSLQGYPATNAYFVNFANPRQGALIAHSNKNPTAMNLNNLDDPIEAPDQIIPLKQWSDVVFLEWREACRISRGGEEANMGKLEHVFRENIINTETVAVLRSIVQKDWLDEDDMVSCASHLLTTSILLICDSGLALSLTQQMSE